jgi:hypothetical protein
MMPQTATPIVNKEKDEQEKSSQHPAAEWAKETAFDAMEVDCTTTVVLKILDNKCKMLPGEKVAVMAVYDVIKGRHANLFSDDTHEVITAARNEPNYEVLETIHELRLFAEANIAKPVMKAYKAKLRYGLFG